MPIIMLRKDKEYKKQMEIRYKEKKTEKKYFSAQINTPTA